MWRSMESGGGRRGGGKGSGRGITAVASGKKRKAAGGGGSGDRAVMMWREPRRGLGVAELERIRVQHEAAQSLFMIPPSLSSSSALATQLRSPPPPHVPGVRYGQQQQHVGNGGVQRDNHFTPYHGLSLQQHCTNDALTRFLAPSGSSQAFSRQINQVADKCVVNVSALLRQQQGSSEELYRLQLQDYHRRRAQPHPQQHGGEATGTARSQSIPFMNLVDSDDDDSAADGGAAAGAGDELDLELRL